MNRNRQNKGITLIALVITIIVMLILAGVTIKLTIGEEGVITRAKYAGETYENAAKDEEEMTRELLKILADNLGGSSNTTGGGSSSSSGDSSGGCGGYVDRSFKEVAEQGDYVKYDTGVEGIGENEDGIVMFRVLYNNESNGLQIISDKNIADVTLGGTDWESAKNSYNGAISTLNSEAMTYIGDLGQDARCVGCIASVDQFGNFIHKNLATTDTVTLPHSIPLPNGWVSRDTGCYDAAVNLLDG